MSYWWFFLFHQEFSTKLKQYLKKATKQEINSLLDKIEKRSLEQGKNLFNEQYQDSKEWVNIQSSWIKYGKFELTNKITNTGNAIFLFQSKVKVYGPYTYPSMPADIWLAIKNANANAGTLFWRIWLRVWLPSMIRKNIKDNLKNKGIYYGKISKNFINAKDIDDLRKYIRKLEQNFYRNIGRDKRRTVREIGTYQWKKNQGQQFKNKRKEYLSQFANTSKPIKFVNKTRKTQKLLRTFKIESKKLQKNIKYVRRDRQWQ
ncbi:hypothetical protein [Spiroplasma endosymbiont of Stenodema calcarata]|uniref:hypothetical protein n=1 Tax=Spiroplasma endosymbiont of Stenodema calcarata TaxID=3139328 RepID=UPI003CCA80CD